MKRIATTLLFLILFPVLLTCQQDDENTYTKIGQTVPVFKVTTIDGKEIDTGAIKGKVLLLNFFATWCAPCMSEMPHLEKEIWKKYADRDDFIVLAIGREHTKEQLVKFNEEKKFTFLIAPDPKRKVYNLFAKKMIPRNYLIDRQGKIVYQAIGYSPKEFEVLKNKVDELLK